FDGGSACLAVPGQPGYRRIGRAAAHAGFGGQRKGLGKGHAGKERTCAYGYCDGTDCQRQPVPQCAWTGCIPGSDI
ncbi:hypothetical protein LPJ56_006882, partial [Coemansia sp. RSA 2599]